MRQTLSQGVHAFRFDRNVEIIVRARLTTKHGIDGPAAVYPDRDLPPVRVELDLGDVVGMHGEAFLSPRHDLASIL